MEPNAQPRRTSSMTILLAILLAIAVIIIILLLKKGYVLPGASESSDSSEYSGQIEKLVDAIDIPGVTALTLTAGETVQNLTIQNPAHNFCLFRISLCLADGTVLWTSNDVRPGEKSDPIVLAYPLEAGVYPNAFLHFECFRDDDLKTPLNGANSKLTLYAESRNKE